MVPLVLSMVYEVGARHLFNAPTFWAYELGYMLAGSSYMFGIAYCLKQGAHIRVDFIYGQLSAKRRALIDVIGYAVLLLPGLLWLDYGLYSYAFEAYEYGEVTGESAWNPVVWPFRTTWVIGFAAFTSQVLAEILKGVSVLLGDVPDETETEGAH
ncbi:MAG: TRAP transporter small permease subunit [Rhodospirillaceae bacterium]|jgi:TRAP-type mannitol/chloroaromatic compound transport system permease small subunit|nr:TRAP transporter small permease subunit [Rhodospirillaceae bacterium]MBT6137971.1 TRAP transporter small permease subunit [Rhodospirillaceae bacterium]